MSGDDAQVRVQRLINDLFATDREPGLQVAVLGPRLLQGDLPPHPPRAPIDEDRLRLGDNLDPLRGTERVSAACGNSPASGCLWRQRR